MADAYYRSLYFSLDSPEDLDILGMLLALPRRRQPSAIKSALRHYLPTVLDGPPLGPDEVRTIVVETLRARGRRRAPSKPNAPSRPSTAPEETSGREIPEPGAGMSRAEDAPDVQTAERLLESRLDQLTKSHWIG
jgi:hypothetical protein